MYLCDGVTKIFKVFQGFPALIETIAHFCQMANFNQFLAKMAKTVKIIKKVLRKFFSHLQALTNCKVSEKSYERFPRKSVADGWTDATPKVSMTSWSRDQKWSKYRFKQPKCIVLGTPKKPEKGQE